jgi:hypothetical protein
VTGRLSDDEVETRACEIYDAWNWANGIPWDTRNETMKNRYREIARDQLIEEAALGSPANRRRP